MLPFYQGHMMVLGRVLMMPFLPDEVLLAFLIRKLPSTGMPLLAASAFMFATWNIEAAFESVSITLEGLFAARVFVAIAYFLLRF
jgi:hypothetical protein